MIVIEVFARGQAPRHKSSSAAIVICISDPDGQVRYEREWIIAPAPKYSPGGNDTSN
jgi:hypothetical protein